MVRGHLAPVVAREARHLEALFVEVDARGGVARAALVVLGDVRVGRVHRARVAAAPRRLGALQVLAQVLGLPGGHLDVPPFVLRIRPVRQVEEVHERLHEAPAQHALAKLPPVRRRRRAPGGGGVQLLPGRPPRRRLDARLPQWLGRDLRHAPDGHGGRVAAGHPGNGASLSLYSDGYISSVLGEVRYGFPLSTCFLQRLCHDPLVTYTDNSSQVLVDTRG